MNTTTRRTFLKHSSILAAFPLLGASMAHGAGNSSKIRTAIFGTGGQGCFHLSDGIWANDDLQIVAVADVYEPHQKGGVLRAWLANAQIAIPHGRPTPVQMEKLNSTTKPTPYYDFREMLAAEDIDAVVIATPPHTHHDIVMACLDAGKHVFLETPLATSIEDGRAIVKKAHETGLVVQLGHQHRYHPNYNLAVMRCRTERFLVRAVEAQLFHHQNGSGKRTLDPEYPFNEEERKHIPTDLEHHLNWRLYSEIAGAPFLDELPRSIDTAHWFTGTPPSRVYALAGLDYWRDGRTAPDNGLVTFEYTINQRNDAFAVIDGRDRAQDINRINRSYTLRSSWSYNRANSDGGVHERILGDKTTLDLSVNNECTFRREAWAEPIYDYRDIYSAEEKEAIWEKYRAMLAEMTKAELSAYFISRGDSCVLDPKNPCHPPPELDIGDPVMNGAFQAVGSEESADVHQFRAFVHHIRNGGTPRANVMTGLAAVIAGASARKSYETGNPVDIDPAWMAFDFDTPSITNYDEGVEAIEA